MMPLEQMSVAAKTIHRLFHFLDDKQFEQLAALFEAQGVWVRQGQNLVGPEAVLQAMKGRPTDLSTRHLVTNLIVEETNGLLDARYYVTVFDYSGSAEMPAPLTIPQAIFVCHDRLIETPAGWRFSSRSPRLVFKRM